MLRPEGVITALVTPFAAVDESIDYAALENMIDIQCDAKVNGVFVSGSTAEAYALGFEEKRNLLKATIRFVKGRAKVYFGAGGDSTHQTVALVRMAEAEGADAVSVITPYFVTPNQQELLEFYSDVAASTGLPIILYNHPLRTAVNIAGATLGKLSHISNIVGVKDSSGNMNNTLSYLTCAEPGFSVLSGNDSLIISLLDMGGAGTVSASANFVPKLVTDMYSSYKAGDRDNAIRLQMDLFKIRDVFGLGTYPAMIKDACRVMGIDMGSCRKPLRLLSPEDLQKLKTALINAGQLS